MLTLPFLLLDAAEVTPVFNGVAVDGTISLVWILSGVCAFVVAMAGFLFGLWLTQRDHTAMFKTMSETVANAHIQHMAETDRLKQDFEIKLRTESTQRMEDIRKLETKQAEAEKQINQKLQTIHESQLKSSACLDSLQPVVTRIEATLHGLFEKYDLPLKK